MFCKEAIPDGWSRLSWSGSDFCSEGLKQPEWNGTGGGGMGTVAWSGQSAIGDRTSHLTWDGVPGHGDALTWEVACHLYSHSYEQSLHPNTVFQKAASGLKRKLSNDSSIG